MDGSRSLCGTITVFNQVSGFGNDFFELTNVRDKEVTYKGLDLRLQRRYRNNWQFLAGLTIGRANQLGGKSGFVPGDPGGISDLYDNPNAQINARGKSPWDRPYILKVSGNRDGHGVSLQDGTEFGDINTDYVRGTLRWLPAENLTVDFIADRTRTRQARYYQFYVFN